MVVVASCSSSVVQPFDLAAAELVVVVVNEVVGDHLPSVSDELIVALCNADWVAVVAEPEVALAIAGNDSGVVGSLCQLAFAFELAAQIL